MLGFETAKRVAALGRSAFFCEKKPDLPLRRSALLRGDDLVPQFCFVGARYPSRRVLLLPINPGNGSCDEIRTPGDDRMMPSLIRFTQKLTKKNFAAAAAAYMGECQQWSIWTRHCTRILAAGDLAIHEIACFNSLPWRTQSKSKFAVAVEKKAAELYVGPLIEELKSSVVVAVGKRADAVLRRTGLPLPEVIVWNRDRRNKGPVEAERAAALEQLRMAVGCGPA
jgi:hypothetical protein